MRSDDGFTLIEMLAILAITSVVLTLGATAFRGYWLRQSLQSAQGQIVTQMRYAQQSTEAESHPIVYGLVFRSGTDDWDLLKYNPANGGSCKQVELQDFDGGVVVETANFTGGTDVRDQCSSFATSGVDQMVFFFARGSATPGTVTIRSEATGRVETVEVRGITGRAVKL